ncbi:hypothetical protein Q8A73_016029 [Channa argus]|nr:hypothetical protein Q8A73_016029 [Channa argus]
MLTPLPPQESRGHNATEDTEGGRERGREGERKRGWMRGLVLAGGCLIAAPLPAPSSPRVKPSSWSLPSAALHPHLVHDFSEPPPFCCSQSWHKISGCVPSFLSFIRSVFPETIQSCCPHTEEAAWQPTAAAAPLHRGMVLSPLVSLSVTVSDIQPNLPLSSFSVSSSLLLLPWVEVEGSFRRSLCKLAPCLASPPSLSVSTSSLSRSPSPPGAAEESQTEQMREKERVREEGGGLRLGAWGPCDSRQRTKGPSTSCPAHAFLKTSVAIDNSCRTIYQPQIPRHKAIGWQDL